MEGSKKFRIHPAAPGEGTEIGTKQGREVEDGHGNYAQHIRQKGTALGLDTLARQEGNIVL